MSQNQVDLATGAGVFKNKRMCVACAGGKVVQFKNNGSYAYDQQIGNILASLDTTSSHPRVAFWSRYYTGGTTLHGVYE